MREFRHLVRKLALPQRRHLFVLKLPFSLQPDFPLYPRDFPASSDQPAFHVYTVHMYEQILVH
jgi:hypothetical protein